MTICIHNDSNICVSVEDTVDKQAFFNGVLL